ncbi:prephenate dehydrogenase/arogenate dehydrogenase family protein [Thalassobaculum sp.]|uniref:NAD(P)-dependent oxidoreductase n=1 Tax=Thalassobaculum sp. TaxID=2022740 RepID=UPI0032EB82FD
MAIHTVAIFTPGDMGHAIGRTLVDNGIRVTTNLADRSRRTKKLAAQAGIEDKGEDVAAIEFADVVLSVLPPDQSVELATRLASAIAAVRHKPLYIDLNAVAPATAVESAEIIDSVGGPFLDGGIIGPPPKPGRSLGPRLYVSGAADAVQFALGLRDAGLDIRVVPGGVGAASALKMCYAAITKGVTALGTVSYAAAKTYGVDRELAAEMAASQRMLSDRFERALPDMAPKAYRWVGEMEEVARTVADVGLDPKLFLGAADIYRLVTATALGQETPEERSIGLTANEVAEIVASALEAGMPTGREE